MTQENTPHQIDVAYNAGWAQAEAEILLGVSSPHDESEVMATDSDVADLAFRVTGEKLDHEGDRAIELADKYTEGYFDRWEICYDDYR